jgi:hypothetical protein
MVVQVVQLLSQLLDKSSRQVLLQLIRLHLDVLQSILKWLVVEVAEQVLVLHQELLQLVLLVLGVADHSLQVAVD